MLEGPKRADRDAQERAQEDARWSEAKDFFSNNPTFVVTLLYLYVTVVGMVYSAALYGRFGINIFDYSETADFLLAAFKNPVAFLSAGILAALSAAYALWTQRSVRSLIARQRVRGWAVQKAVGASEEEADEYVRQFEEDRERFLRRRIVFLVIAVPVAIVCLSLILPYVSATTKASSLKDGEKPAVDVRHRSFSGSEGQVTEPGLELIGATQKAAFFYDVNDNHTLVIPQAQIVSIEVPE